MNRTVFVAAAFVLAASCKSRESTEVTVTTTGTGTGSATDPAAPVAKPKSTTRQRLEKSLRKRFADTGFTTFTCPEVGSTESETTCTIAADNGAKLPSKITRTKQDEDGTWSSWETNVDKRVISTDELAEKIHDGVMAEVKKAHPKATAELACGTSPIVFENHIARCKLTLHDPDKVVDIKIDDSKDAFDWSADAF
jgi:hypothetical protein